MKNFNSAFLIVNRIHVSVLEYFAVNTADEWLAQTSHLVYITLIGGNGNEACDEFLLQGGDNVTILQRAT